MYIQATYMTFQQVLGFQAVKPDCFRAYISSNILKLMPVFVTDAVMFSFGFFYGNRVYLDL